MLPAGRKRKDPGDYRHASGCPAETDPFIATCSHPEDDHDYFGCEAEGCTCMWGTPYGYRESSMLYRDCHTKQEVKR